MNPEAMQPSQITKSERMMLKVSIADKIGKNLYLNPIYSKENKPVDSQYVKVFDSDKIFKMQFREQIPEGECHLSLDTKSLIFRMQDPQDLQLQPVSQEDLEIVKNVKFLISSYDSKTIKCSEIKQKLFEKSLYCNNYEMFSLTFKEKNFATEVDFRAIIESNQEGGFITKQTQIVFEKQLHQQFSLIQQNDESPSQSNEDTDYSDDNLRGDDFYKQMKVKIGGHDQHLKKIQRFIFNSRQLTPEMIKMMGLTHAKGILLYGPPGTGKTAIARQIAENFGLTVTVINASEIMDKYVGESERKIREPFEKAAKDQKQKGHRSPVHVVIIDQIDAICKQRGSSGGIPVYDSIVNQLLTCIDGVNQLNNILLIAMTNRKDLLDPALLRSGRIQVHIQIGLPNLEGRKQVFKIHTKKWKSGSEAFLHEDVNLDKLAELTDNYTGAQILGLTRKAFCFALEQWRLNGFSEDQIGKEFFIHQDHFLKALQELVPQFGTDKGLIEQKIPTHIISTQNLYSKVDKELDLFVEKIQSRSEGKFSLLISGDKGVGKTAIACLLAKKLNFSYTKMINVDKLIGCYENRKAQKILEIYFDALKCSTSCLILDEILDLIEYIPLGDHFCKVVLLNLIALLKKTEQKNKKIVIIATQSNKKILKLLGLYNIFEAKIDVPCLGSQEIQYILKETYKNSEQITEALQIIKSGSLKDILDVIQLSLFKKQPIINVWNIINQKKIQNLQEAELVER